MNWDSIAGIAFELTAKNCPDFEPVNTNVSAWILTN